MLDIVQTFVVIHPRIVDDELLLEIIGVYSDRQTAIRAKNHSDQYYISESYNNIIELEKVV